MIAFLTPQELDIIAPVVVAALFVLAFVLGMFARHQRNMAVILRQPVGTDVLEEVRALRHEVGELRSLVHVQALQLAQDPATLAERLEQKH